MFRASVSGPPATSFERIRILRAVYTMLSTGAEYHHGSPSSSAPGPSRTCRVILMAVPTACIHRVIENFASTGLQSGTHEVIEYADRAWSGIAATIHVRLGAEQILDPTAVVALSRSKALSGAIMTVRASINSASL